MPQIFLLSSLDVTDEILHEYVGEDGYVYVEVRKGMYSLPQASLLP